LKEKTRRRKMNYYREYRELPRGMQTELDFRELAAEKGFDVSKRGWPDFDVSKRGWPDFILRKRPPGPRQLRPDGGWAEVG